MSDFSTIGGDGIRVESFGANLLESRGIIVAPSATANTKGSYVELISSTSFDYEILTLYFRSFDAATASIDIAVGGAGSEEIIVPDLMCGKGVSNSKRLMSEVTIPLKVAKGSRISVRCQLNMASALGVRCMGKGLGGSFGDTGGLSGIDVIGFNSGNTEGTNVDPGVVANTLGSWYEIVSSTARSYKGFFFVVDNNNNIAPTFAYFLLDVAIGSASSEELIYPEHNFTSDPANYWGNTVSSFIPHAIPSGTRIAARAQCSSNNGVDRQFNLTLYGMY